jgi:hypothetical protein
MEESEIVVTKEELIELFDNEIVVDTDHGWFMNGVEVEIIAIHDKETKYIQDISNAKQYKLKRKGR